MILRKKPSLPPKATVVSVTSVPTHITFITLISPSAIVFRVLNEGPVFNTNKSFCSRPKPAEDDDEQSLSSYLWGVCQLLHLRTAQLPLSRNSIIPTAIEKALEVPLASSPCSKDIILHSE